VRISLTDLKGSVAISTLICVHSSMTMRASEPVPIIGRKNLVQSMSLAVWGWVMSDSRWRVVAVRRNGKVVVLDEYLSLERAEDFQKSLLSINAFPEVRIEPDTEGNTSPVRDAARCGSPLCEQKARG